MSIFSVLQSSYFLSQLNANERSSELPCTPEQQLRISSKLRFIVGICIWV